MSKRKILLLAMSLCMVAILAVGGTLAYFTAEETADNVFTVGNVDVDIEEPDWEEPEDAYPGQVLPKNPQVSVKTGSNPCYARVIVTGLDCLITAELSEQLVGYGVYDEDGNVLPDTTHENWVLHEIVTEEDGSLTYYFYYYDADGKGGLLEADASTGPVFDAIVIPTDLKNDFSGNEYHVVVKVQAVQAQGAPAAEAESGILSLDELKAWFEICFE